MKLNDFRLLVNDFAASFHFWHEIVGLSTIFRDENNTYAELDAGNVRLQLLRADYFAASVGSPLPETRQEGFPGAVAFQVDHLEAAAADRGHHATPTLAPPHHHTPELGRVSL